jgi:uncharacterized membrane protein YdjX (TVP38/TMEM64 family)
MTGTAKRLLLLVVLLVAIGAALIYREYLTVPRIRAVVGDLGPWGPIVFILVYGIAPALLLPGLPLDLAAGVLFGPVWGVVYTSIGSTLGATVAFLVARTLGREWVQRTLSGRLARIKEGVEAEGWRFVAFTRLVPIIPFNLLNYALGLTRIGLIPYVLASFVFMLPATVAYVYAGWAGGEAASGEETLLEALTTLLIALAGLGIIAAIPRVYSRWIRRRADRPGRRTGSLVVWPAALALLLPFVC